MAGASGPGEAQRLCLWCCPLNGDRTHKPRPSFQLLLPPQQPPTHMSTSMKPQLHLTVLANTRLGPSWPPLLFEPLPKQEVGLLLDGVHLPLSFPPQSYTFSEVLPK